MCWAACVATQYLEAKDAIEDANDSFETTYFDEDMEDAQAAVHVLATQHRYKRPHPHPH